MQIPGFLLPYLMVNSVCSTSASSNLVSIAVTFADSFTLVACLPLRALAASLSIIGTGACSHPVELASDLNTQELRACSVCLDRIKIGAYLIHTKLSARVSREPGACFIQRGFQNCLLHRVLLGYHFPIENIIVCPQITWILVPASLIRNLVLVSLAGVSPSPSLSSKKVLGPHMSIVTL